MSTSPTSRASRLRDILGASVIAVGVCFTLTAGAGPNPSEAPAAPLAARLHEANDSLNRLKHPDMESGPGAGGVQHDHDHDHDRPGGIWGNFWPNFNPWRNWNNWPNWHNFNQWANF